MARYIDADKLWNDRPQVTPEKSMDYKAGFSECMWAFSKLIREQIDNSTADVVPKSEYDAVVSAVDNSTKEFLKLHDKYQDIKRESENYKSIAETQQKLSMKRYFEIKQLKQELDEARATVERLEQEIKALLAFKDYFSDLYGHGLEIANWHENGALEPFDNFFESAEDEYEAELKKKYTEGDI